MIDGTKFYKNIKLQRDDDGVSGNGFIELTTLQRLGGLRPVHAVHAIPEMPRTQNNIDSEENRTIGGRLDTVKPLMAWYHLRSV